MRFDDIKKMIEDDIVIDPTELDKEALKTPQLHGKYLNILTDEKLSLSKYRSDYKRLKRNKWLYYTGKLSEEELRDLNWEPFGLSILKSDIDKFLDSDEELIKIKDKIVFIEEKVNYLESTIKMISNRQWLIREAIDWVKFTHGT
jgi:hypothetical protein|tara:strand:- start:259 stop:693 length:435 start_codon:yes stop_codon:yes gene_type:complete